MANTKFLSLLFAFLFVLLLQHAKVEALEYTVPAVFIFGDSTSDVGNNNYMKCAIKANFSPYGIDFPGGIATGRFSNGYNTIDFLCKWVGLNRSPPPFLSIPPEDICKQALRGINFASAGSGIINGTGNNFGIYMSMNVQLDYFAAVVANLTKKVGRASAELLLSKSLFLVSTGSNDMFENFNILNSTNSNGKDTFITNLGSIYKDQLRTLYNNGARKIGIISIPPIGCCPSQRAKSTTGDCLDALNEAAQLFYATTVDIMHDLSLELNGLNYSIGNVYTMVSDFYQNPLAFGFKELETACCGNGSYNGQVQCGPNTYLCRNRNEYLFWDLYHPTQAASRLASLTLYGGLERYSTPINIKQLVTDDN